MSDADDVLAHSEDEGEWSAEPVVIERRPSGTQVVSARLPSGLAHVLLAEAARRGLRPSEIVREAVEHYLNPPVWKVIRLQPGERVRFFLTTVAYDTTNPVVTSGDLPRLQNVAV